MEISQIFIYFPTWQPILIPIAQLIVHLTKTHCFRFPPLEYHQLDWKKLTGTYSEAQSEAEGGSSSPTAAVLGFQIDRTNILNERKIVKPNALLTSLQGPKIQYGRWSPGTVILTFFLWEIIQKFFFLP